MILNPSNILLIDDALSDSESQFTLDLARSHLYDDEHDFYTFYKPHISDGFRIFAQRGSYETNSKNDNPLLNLPNDTPIDRIIGLVLDGLEIDQSAAAVCAFRIMPNRAYQGLHIDSKYSAAFIYYLDREWSIDNGGELICYPGLKVSHDDFNAMLVGQPLDQARFKGVVGQSFAPIYNRLVAFKTGTPHRVVRTENYRGVGRIALAGFLK